MKFGSGILGVYAPVLLAAVLIMTVAPTCVMPSCGFVRGGAVTVCAAPQPQQFTSACSADTRHAPVNAPCQGGSCDDATMTHGTPDAVAAPDAPFPATAAAAVALAPVAPAPALLGHVDAAVQLVDTHPPDPLGVRLLV